MVKKYMKKPVVIEAIQFTGEDENIEEIKSFMNNEHVIFDKELNCLFIETLEGIMRADLNNYIIKGVKGEFYPCKCDIFNDTYNEVL